MRGRSPVERMKEKKQRGSLGRGGCRSFEGEEKKIKRGGVGELAAVVGEEGKNSDPRGGGSRLGRRKSSVF